MKRYEYNEFVSEMINEIDNILSTKKSFVDCEEYNDYRIDSSYLNDDEFEIYCGFNKKSLINEINDKINHNPLEVGDNTLKLMIGNDEEYERILRSIAYTIVDAMREFFVKKEIEIVEVYGFRFEMNEAVNRIRYRLQGKITYHLGYDEREITKIVNSWMFDEYKQFEEDVKEWNRKWEERHNYEEI